MIHLLPLPRADLALPGVAIDAGNPLVLPARWRDRPAADGCSGSVPSAAGDRAPENVPPPQPPVPLNPPAAGQTFLDALAAERRRQVEQFGHTPEQDLRGRFRQLTDPAARFLTHAVEDVQFRTGDVWRDQARRHLAQAGAMLAAAWDFIDNGGER